MKGQRSPRPFALAPLLDRLRRDYGLDETEARALVDTGAETWRRASREGLTIWTADAWAIRCGLHPAEVWPDWIKLAAADDDEELDAPAMMTA